MDRAKEAFRIAGVDENRIFVTNSAARADDAIAHANMCSAKILI
jgi:hypothetical protein